MANSDFIQVAQAMDSMRSKWFQQTTKNGENSFTGIQIKMKNAWRFIQNEKKEFEAELKKISDTGMYNPSFVQKERNKIVQRFRDICNEIMAGIEKDIHELIQTKIIKLDQMVMTPPSADQMELLKALQMRGKNISRAELVRVLPKFFGSYQGLKILETVALAAGYSLHAMETAGVDASDVITLYDQLDQAGNYLLMAAGELGKADRKPDLKYRAFYYDDPQNPGNADPIFFKWIQLLDRLPQLKDFSVPELSNAEAAQVEVIFRDLDGLDMSNTADELKALRITQRILVEHPEIRPLAMKSRYAGIVSEVESLEEIQKRKERKIAADIDQNAEVQNAGKLEVTERKVIDGKTIVNSAYNGEPTLPIKLKETKAEEAEPQPAQP